MIKERVVFAVCAAIAIAAAPAAAQDEVEWSWSGPVPAGRAIEIKGVNGGITAVGGSGPDVVIRVTKRGRRNDPEDVRMVVLEHDRGVTVCAIYPHREGRDPNECAPGSGGRNNVHNNDVVVEWRIEVPAGVEFIGRNVNGGIKATGLTATSTATTVNGSIDVEAAGVTRAHTVNGSINVTLGSAEWQDELAFETTNGSITARMPADLNAIVTARTVNGRIDTDFPITVTGRINRRELTGTVGSGGRNLVLQTVNGSIHLVRR